MSDALAEFDPNRRYNSRELGELADEILREDARSELCRECGGRGERTGFVVDIEQGIEDESGAELVVAFPEFACENDHRWYQGEGAVRGIGGENPILFEEHFQSRRRREIYNSLGSPDPSIVSGIYNRAHPQGRKINTAEARKKHGASWYRAYFLPLIPMAMHICHLHLLPF